MATKQEVADYINANLASAWTDEEEAKIDAEKCQGKGNKSAGVRLRKICQEVREELKQIRFGVQQLKD